MKTIALSVDSLEQFARPSKLLPGRSAFDLVFLGARSAVFDRGLAEICALPAQIRKCN